MYSAPGRLQRSRDAQGDAGTGQTDLREIGNSYSAQAAPLPSAQDVQQDPVLAQRLRAERLRAEYLSPPFRSGEERRSSGGSLETSLSVRYAQRKAWRPETKKTAGGMEVVEPAGLIDLKLRTYDGLPVGPTLRVKAGETLRIKLKNDLPVERPVDHVTNPNVPSEFNRTNLHTHGLHVSPVGNSDNVLLEVRPGEEFVTEVAVPADHIPGTFWYHAHVHGPTAIQVSSGMAGALIVEPREGDARSLDAVPGIAGATERICVLQQISFLPETPDPARPDEKIYTLENFAAFGNGRWPRGKIEDGWRTTINGQLQPTIRIKSGEMQRFRLIHGGIRDVINVQFSPLPDGPDAIAEAQYDPEALNEGVMREIALDGIPLDRVRKVERSVQLFPGYRSDVLVRLINDGPTMRRYVMWDGLTDNDLSLDPAVPDLTKTPAVLAVIEVEPSTDLPEPWPTEHDFAKVGRPDPIPAHEVLGLQTVEFTLGEPLGARINDEPYDPAAPPMTVKLGRADEWRLTRGIGNHPFHIHVNPFYVVSETDANGVTTPIGVWKDTLVIEGNKTHTIRTRYERYVGDFVIHCHILDHEDAGMMKGVRVANAQYEIATKIASPYLVPLWTLPDEDGTQQKLADLMGTKHTIVVYLESLNCPMCDKQLTLFRERHGELPADAKVVFVAPGAPVPIAPALPFPLVFDQTLERYKEYGVYLDAHKTPLHGAFVLDAQGRVRWREISDRPYVDFDGLLKELKLIK